MGRPRRRLLAAAMAVAVLAIVACEDTTPDPESAAEVERTVAAYLGALADAYSNLDVGPLEEWASPNEVVRVRSLLEGLAMTGDRVDSTLLGYEVDYLEIFRDINATVRLIEVWDVVRYDAFSGEVKGRTPDSIQRSVLQLRRVDGRWIVIGRTVLERETPVPEGPEEGG